MSFSTESDDSSTVTIETDCAVYKKTFASEQWVAAIEGLGEDGWSPKADAADGCSDGALKEKQDDLKQQLAKVTYVLDTNDGTFELKAGDDGTTVVLLKRDSKRPKVHWFVATALAIVLLGGTCWWCRGRAARKQNRYISLSREPVMSLGSDASRGRSATNGGAGAVQMSSTRPSPGGRGSWNNDF